MLDFSNKRNRADRNMEVRATGKGGGFICANCHRYKIDIAPSLWLETPVRMREFGFTQPIMPNNLVLLSRKLPRKTVSLLPKKNMMSFFSFMTHILRKVIVSFSNHPLQLILIILSITLDNISFRSLGVDEWLFVFLINLSIQILPNNIKIHFFHFHFHD